MLVVPPLADLATEVAHLDAGVLHVVPVSGANELLRRPRSPAAPG